MKPDELITKHSGNRNIYQIIKDIDGFFLLKCVSYNGLEDMGDLIFCNRICQEIWVAKFHKSNFCLL
jgi:hypothetical protein